MINSKYLIKITQAILLVAINVFGMIFLCKFCCLLFSWHPNMDKINQELQKAHNQHYCYLTEETVMNHNGIAKRVYYRRCEE